MQYIVFSIQASIDNVELTTLLDNADNVWPADGDKRFRKGRSLFAEIKTAAPPMWTSPPNLFYSSTISRRDLAEYVVNPTYLNIVDRGLNTAIPINLTHYTEYLEQLSFAETLKKDVCAIYVYSNNKTRLHQEIAYNLDGEALINARDNIANIDPLDQELQASLYPNGFDAVIEMDRIWTDWDYLNGILTGIGINLRKSVYDRYLSMFGRG